MDCVELFKNRKQTLRSIYDIMAISYASLLVDLRKRHLTEYDFLASYIDTIATPGIEESDSENRSRHRLTMTINECVADLQKWFRSLPLLATPFGVQRLLDELPAQMRVIEDRLLPVLENKGILDDLELYILLLVCDNYAQADSQNRYQRGYSGPLNFVLLDRVRLYFASDRSLFSPSMESLRISPQDTHTPVVQDKMSAVRFIEATQIDSSHSVVISSYRMDGALECIENNGNRLRIAIAPFIGQKVTEFPMVTGTAKFIPHHSDEYAKEGIRSVIRIMEKALEKGCNIIIFPEYMIEAEMVQAIRDFLDSKTFKELLFVAAGTRWTSENANELLILDRHGEIIGRYHKYAPFSEYRKIGKTGQLMRLTENLQNPGDEISLIDIKDIGRFAFAICRDVCVAKGESNALISSVINCLQPNFLIVPAWSGSIESGFNDQFRAFGEERTVSILCNCCEPIATSPHHDSLKTRILVGTPCKDNPDKSCVSGKTEAVCCNEMFSGVCPHRDCFFIIELDLSEEHFHTGSEVIVSHTLYNDL